MQPAAWIGTVKEFLDSPREDLLAYLVEHSQETLGEDPKSSQLKAWRDSADILQRCLKESCQTNISLPSWQMLWEFELPRERGRRPDVILLGPGQAWILEFKGDSEVRHADLDQVSAYARDLANYHAGSHDLTLHPVLIPTRSHGLHHHEGPIVVVSPDVLEAVFINGQANERIPDGKEWVKADYQPLPSIVSAARRLFRREALPQIRRAQSAGIPDALKTMRGCVTQARETQTHHLILLTGVPGAGKTLAGLQFVYDQHLGGSDSERSAVFLSGNGPLVQVLQYTLDNRTFVQDVHAFLRQYGGQSQRIPDESIWVYDEAQRAWDAERVQQKRQHGTSEPEDFLRIGEKKPWAVMVGLIGDGQEIHIGEESGLAQWDEAIGKVSEDWHVTCPPRLYDQFPNAAAINVSASLDLTMSLRTHVADQSHAWVEHLLKGELYRAATLAHQLREADYALYLTRNLRSAQYYAEARYGEASDYRFGLIASSKASDLPKHGIPNGYQQTKKVELGPWYSDPPNSPKSCCQLDSVATEFSCQGLELDLAIVGWGNDLKRQNGCWRVKPPGRSSKAKNPEQLRINSYRVLLTRGRDGFVVFLPPDQQYDETAKALVQSGVREIGT